MGNQLSERDGHLLAVGMMIEQLIHILELAKRGYLDESYWDDRAYELAVIIHKALRFEKVIPDHPLEEMFRQLREMGAIDILPTNDHE